MAQLPSENFLVQSEGTEIFLTHRYTDEILVAVDAKDRNAVAQSQKIIHDLPELGEEDKCFAHFWFGYFYANLG